MIAEVKPDVLIVLGGGINAKGILSDTSIARIKYAFEHYQQQPTPIIVSGRWSLLSEVNPPRSEGEAMAAYLIEQGVKEIDLYIENESMETIGNAYFSYVHYIRSSNWSSVTVITSEFHRERAQYAFTKVMGNAYRVQIQYPKGNLAKHENTALQAREHIIYSFIRQLFDPITNRDLTAIHAKLQELPGYSDNPFYTRKDLLHLITRDIPPGSMYNVT